MIGYRKHIFLIALVLLSTAVVGQKKTKIFLHRANDLKYDKRIGPNIQRLIGDVVLRHDSTWFYCDSAYLNSKDNLFDAYGNVHINVNDTLDIYGDSLNYVGATKIAVMHENVKLVDNRATLTTDHLTYNRNTGIAYYNTGGRIISDENVLTSRIGYYYTRQNEFFFKDDVVLTNPDYVMNSDTLMYNTKTEVAYFYGPTTIVSDENYIYCERGWYDTENDISQLTKNPYIIHNEQTMEGDSIYYDEGREYGEAYNNIVLTDTVENIIVKGNYGEFDQKKGYAFVTDSTVAIFVEQNDSLFLHADTLLFTEDTITEEKTMFAFHKVKFFRADLQGMADSMVYFAPDSTLFLYKEPVLWSEENQMSADSIKMVYANQEIDTMVLYNNCLIISQDDTATFNQIKGKLMVGYFKDNGIRKITVSGNSQTIYFARDEDGLLIGINKVVSSKMLIKVSDNEIRTITYIDNPEATMYPEDEFPQEEMQLKGFKWLADRRPLRKEDIFEW